MAKIILPNDKRFQQLSDVWDIPKFKLFCFVVEAKDLPCMPKSQIICQARVERKVFGKTAPLSSAAPKWASLMWVGFDDPEIKTLVFDVYDKKAHLGEVRLSLLKAPKEALVDTWVPLKAAETKKGAPAGAPVTGLLHLRYIFSAVPETRPNRVQDGIQQEYFYKKNGVVFRSGDLIAYSGVGLLATATRLLHNSEHSHVGLVVQMPNKWHGDPELYVLELTNNIDGFIDPFSEKARQGLVLFRLQERLHAFHGGLITHYPLRKKLEAIPIDDLADSVRRVHIQAEVPKVINSAVTQFVLRNFPFDAKRNLMEFVSLTGPRFISSALTHIAVLKENQIPPPLELTVEWLKRQDIWDRPNLVRLPKEALKVAMATVGRNSSTVKKKVGGQDTARRPSNAGANRPAEVGVSAQQQQLREQQQAALQQQRNYEEAQRALQAQQDQQRQAMAAATAKQSTPSMAVNPAMLAQDPALAAMEAEMKRLEAEANKQAAIMAAQAKKLEEEQRALEAAMLASEAQMKELQANSKATVHGVMMDEEGHSDEAGDDGGDAANSNLMALHSAGFDFKTLDANQIRLGINNGY